jgi:hypothetical protein
VRKTVAKGSLCQSDTFAIRPAPLAAAFGADRDVAVRNDHAVGTAAGIGAFATGIMGPGNYLEFLDVFFGHALVPTFPDQERWVVAEINEAASRD